MLRAMSPQAYEMLRLNSMTIKPLPTNMTLSNKLSHFKCAPGLQAECFKLLSAKLSTEDAWSAQSVLMFDEMQIRESFEYCGRLKRMYKNHKKNQVVMLREVFNCWKNYFILLEG